MPDFAFDAQSRSSTPLRVVLNALVYRQNNRLTRPPGISVLSYARPRESFSMNSLPASP